MNEEFYKNLILQRDTILTNIINILKDVAVEGHVLGSVARGNSDSYSDLDVWITIDDTSWENFKINKMNYLSQIGEFIHLCEPPQNAPLNGIFSSVFFKQNENIVVTDFYFCPLSSAFTTNESKNLFGDMELPKDELSLNPQQIPVPETYRIDFLICFIFGTIKKIVRKKENSLELVLQQYENLNSKYGINVKQLMTNPNPFIVLKKIIENTKEVATPKQIEVLEEIELFTDKVRSVENL